ncbi:MAG: T9SS type A sorting domain-containing protein [Flavipsychrobacter sp.]|nr:T9SS type A sorting domain-containing protein [Flavipsychrobacter sp.]
MRKILLSIMFCLIGAGTVSAQFCDQNGNLVIFSNYDGGILNIDVDVNIPNLKIGVVSYEAIQINITGAFAGNVTEVHYAGYNDPMDGCSQGVTTTVINSTGSTNTIVFAPPVTLSNTNGYSSIICAAYSCDNNVNQGGCNTADQIEDYFLTYFSGSTIRSHSLQYNCFSGTQLISAGGNCCGTVTALSAQASATAITCNGDCNAAATATASGGVPPYTYQWSGGPATAVWPNLCAGTYTVTVTDGNNVTDTASVVIAQPVALGSTISDTACTSYTFNSVTYNTSGTYYDTLTAQNGCDSIITLNLTIGTGVNANTTLTSGTLTSSQAGGTYQWVSCPAYTAISGATAQSYTPTGTGNYAVIVSYLGCSDTSTCTNVIPTGIGHLATTLEFNIYPNPARTEVYIEGTLSGTYRITDQLGRVVITGEHPGGRTAVSLANLSSGLYFVEMNGSQPVKLFKQ